MIYKMVTLDKSVINVSMQKTSHFHKESVYLCEIYNFSMLHMSFINIINILLAGVLLFFAVRYLYTLYLEGFHRPEEWAIQLKAGKISPELNNLRRIFKDKTRFYTFWLQAERIRKQQLAGSMAEVGVYKGETAMVLHKMLPKRSLHLFDTFQGFPADDLKHESGKAAGYSPKNFADTSIEAVKKRLGNSDKIHFHCGYFPDTTAGLENEKFCLVNLDADLYMPTKAALNFFYPRLTKGGVIFIHDYNSDWEGLKKAVDEFVKGIPEELAIIPDQYTTVLIIKS